jgi:hypothetical protein
MISRKAQGLPINTIIIVALALIVLIVMIAIFTGRIGLFGKGLAECKGTGKSCTTTAEECTTAGGAATPMKNCNSDEDPEPEGSYCCIRVS